MAPVLSKDVADIEVPTARGLARGGRGAPPVGPRKAAAATAGPGKEWHSRKLCLRGRFSGSGGDAEGRGAGARPGPPGEKWAAPRLEGCPLGWDLAVYFGAGLKKSLKGSDGRTTRVGKKWTFLFLYPSTPAPSPFANPVSVSRLGTPVCSPHLQSLNSEYLQRWSIEIKRFCVSVIAVPASRSIAYENNLTQGRMGEGIENVKNAVPDRKSVV